MTWTPQPQVQWQAEGGDAADPRLMTLLAGIAAHGALAAAARGIGLSYRHAWSLLRPWIAPSPRALAILRRGEGATLTAAGEALLARHTELTQRLALATSEWLSQIADAGSGPPLACAASHDLLLEQLPALARPHGLDLDITFRGSDEAIAALAAGQVALAGFHVPLDSAGDAAPRRCAAGGARRRVDAEAVPPHAGADRRAPRARAHHEPARPRAARRALRQPPARVGHAATVRFADRRRAHCGHAHRRLCARGIHPCRGGGDGRRRRRGCGIRHRRRGRALRAGIRADRAGVVLPGDAPRLVRPAGAGGAA